MVNWFLFCRKEAIQAAIAKKKECNTRALEIVQQLIEPNVEELWLLDNVSYRLYYKLYKILNQYWSKHTFQGSGFFSAPISLPIIPELLESFLPEFCRSLPQSPSFYYFFTVQFKVVKITNYTKQYFKSLIFFWDEELVNKSSKLAIMKHCYLLYSLLGVSIPLYIFSHCYLIN